VFALDLESASTFAEKKHGVLVFVYMYMYVDLKRT
jgi:hypothetical protein